jgi:hypothetical protein
MQVHQQLYSLGVTLGRDVFDDSAMLRGALDDFLAEGAASTGEINLLVDAVQLGGLRMLLTSIEGGANPQRAIEAAGDFLSRERGTADVAGSRWACAVLGFAMGKVSETDVDRFARPQGPPSVGPAPLEHAPIPAPAAPTAVVPHPATPPWPPSGGQPNGGGTPPFYPAATPSRSRWPLAAAAAAVVLVLIGAVAWFALAKDSGDESTAGRAGSTSAPTAPTGPTSPTAPTTPTTPSKPSPTDLDAVAWRYGSLAANITHGLSGCVARTPSSGETEHLDCSFGRGTLALITFDSAAGLKATRGQVVTTEPNTRYSEQAAGIYFSEAPEKRRASLYWDNSAARQSATYVAAPTVKVDALVAMFKATSPAVAYPDSFDDATLRKFAGEFVRLGTCERIDSLGSGYAEESRCKNSRGDVVYFIRFATARDFFDRRAAEIADAKRLDGKNTTWSFADGPVEGRYELYDSGGAVLYWDQTDSHVAGLAVTSDHDVDALARWWSHA